MKIAVLFDGGGLARLGLEQAGHKCTGFELDAERVYLGKRIGSGRVEWADATEVSLKGFDAVWASPPCQRRSMAAFGRTKDEDRYKGHTDNLVEWSLAKVREVGKGWVENVISPDQPNDWGTYYNAAQFIDPPRQNRNRIIGGVHRAPKVYTPYVRAVPGIVPCVTCWEWKYAPGRSGHRYASRFYKRVMTIEEAAYAQGLKIPDLWYGCPAAKTDFQWRTVLYSAIGDGVPVYMSRAFGLAERK